MSKTDKELAVELTCSYIAAIANAKNSFQANPSGTSGLWGGGSKYVIHADDVSKAFDIFYKHISEKD